VLVTVSSVGRTVRWKCVVSVCARGGGGRGRWHRRYVGQAHIDRRQGGGGEGGGALAKSALSPAAVCDSETGGIPPRLPPTHPSGKMVAK
jgi:hypothetical protein